MTLAEERADLVKECKTAHESDFTLTLDSVKSRLLQEEQRMQKRNQVQSPKKTPLLWVLKTARVLVAKYQTVATVGANITQSPSAGTSILNSILSRERREKLKAAGLVAKDKPVPESSDSEPKVSICLIRPVCNITIL